MYLLQITRRAMAAEFQVLLNSGEQPAAPDAAVQALDLLEPLEQQMSAYRPDSEISRLNARGFAGPQRVELRLFYLLRRAAAVHRETGGAFDVTAGPLAKVWGFHQRQGRFPAPQEIETALLSVGSQHLEFNEPLLQLRFLQEGLSLNLGGIGKGYALDRCGDLLRDSEVRNFLVQGGRSSVLASGRRLRGGLEGWKVGLAHPLTPRKRLGELLLRDAALGTSGCGNQYFFHQGKRYSHILDPRTGYPADQVHSASVIAATAADADALATAFYVMGPEGVQSYCREHPEIAAVVVCPDRRGQGMQVLQFNVDASDRVDLTLL